MATLQKMSGLAQRFVELEEAAANVYGLAQGKISSSKEEFRRHITAVNR